MSISAVSKSRTKIIATIGPATSAKDMLREMFIEGIDVCRLNFSHGTHEEHARVIRRIHELNDELNMQIAVLVDLQGPKIRIGQVKNDLIVLLQGNTIEMVTEECTGDENRLFLNYSDFPVNVNINDKILIDDGKISLRVIETNRKNRVTAEVVHGGKLSSRKGVNLPNTKISLPSLTEKDIQDIGFLAGMDIDWIGLSFVREAVDIHNLRKMIEKEGMEAGIVAKIEKPEALRDIDAIIKETDAIMIARGDLGVEVPFDEVPYHQKCIVRKCIQQSKPVIIATQMLESMISNFRPTRAEVSDVANAVYDGADTLMLSAETSVGTYPLAAVKAMQSIIDFAEQTEFDRKQYHQPEYESPSFLADMVSYHATKMADVTGAKAIVTFTAGGLTATYISSNRPRTKIFAFTSGKKTIRKLSLVWGVESYYLESYKSVNDAIEQSMETLKEHNIVQKGDVIVHLGSLPELQSDLVNVLKISTIE